MSELSKQLLRRMYLDEFNSVSYIATRLGRSQSNVNYWIKKHDIPKRSISAAVYHAHNPDGDPFKIRNVDSIHSAFLMGMGLGLYWGEGNKKNPNSIRLGNTDPLLIKKFVLFLRDMLGVSTTKLRFGLQIFSDVDVSRALRFWMSNLRTFGVSKNQFQKPVVTPARAFGTYRQKSMCGVLTVYCGNIKLKRLLDEILAKHAV